MVQPLPAALALAGALSSPALARGAGYTDADPVGLAAVLGLGLLVALAFGIGAFVVDDRPRASRLCLILAAIAVLIGAGPALAGNPCPQRRAVNRKPADHARADMPTVAGK